MSEVPVDHPFSFPHGQLLVLSFLNAERALAWKAYALRVHVGYSAGGIMWHPA